MQMKGYQAGISEFSEASSAVFGISTDDQARNTEFAESLDLEFVLLSDTKGEVASAYGVHLEGPNMAKRVTFVVGQDKKIAYVGEGREAMDPNFAAGACAKLQ